MLFTTLALLSCAVASASAHFQLQYPPARGAFVANQEVNFYGYTQAAENRTQFPLSGGFVSIDSHHPKYTVGIIVSTAQNPTSFDNFSTAVNFFSNESEGPLCFPINLNSTGIDGIRDGANVTIQVVFDGGDDKLYQCSDVTLSNNFTVPSNVTCSNSTESSHSSSSGAPAPTSSGSSSSAQTTSAIGLGALLSVVGLVSVAI
ncbi:hypothetical protein K474DRAFT_1703238 [Panus rudis PR-1116 ss-1]|nr:hypothetical protein K474DRAFT_1703238 [Panus rudis PR-1116 ss-1]